MEKWDLPLQKVGPKKKTNQKISIIEKEDLSANYKNVKNVNIFKNFDDFFLENEKIDFVVLAIKPQQLNSIKNDILKIDKKKPVFISILAGKSTNWFEENISSEIKIVRAMPNLPASISRGVTGVFCSRNITSNEKLVIEQILSSIGTVSFVLNEEQIDVITGISGSGPAYFFYLTEALIEIAIDLGISKDKAIDVVNHTFIGSAFLLNAEKSNDVITLRKNVTSPGGTTEAALKILMNEDKGLKSLLKKSILSAINRAKELDN